MPLSQKGGKNTMKEENRETAKLFKAARKELGLRANVFASLLDISRPYACLIEQGERRLSGKLMLKIEKLRALSRR